MQGLKVYLKLFTTSLYLSTFTFGGGYVIVPLLRKKFVEELEWINDEEMMDLTAIAQSAPGSIAVNASVLIGYKIKGIVGALCCTLGTVLPPLIVLSVVSHYYVAFKQNPHIAAALHSMQAAVAAIIIDVVYQMAKHLVKPKEIIPVIVMTLAFVASFVFQINVLLILLICAIIGIISKKRRLQ